MTSKQNSKEVVRGDVSVRDLDPQNLEDRGTSIDNKRASGSDQLTEFNTRHESFRNSYGERSMFSIPEHLKNPKLHYVGVGLDEVEDFLMKGYLVSTDFNKSIPDDRIGVANKTGSVANFGTSLSRKIVMCIPKTWKEERDKKQAELNLATRKDLLSKKRFGESTITGKIKGA